MPSISDNIKRRMCLHGMDDETAATMDSLRMRFIELAARLEEILPSSPERSSAIHHLDDALSDSVKALARHHENVDPDASFQTLTRRLEKSGVPNRHDSGHPKSLERPIGVPMVPNVRGRGG